VRHEALPLPRGKWHEVPMGAHAPNFLKAQITHRNRQSAIVNRKSKILNPKSKIINPDRQRFHTLIGRL